MIRGIIFDLDGVIVSTDKYHYEAWKSLADKENIYFDEEINNNLRGVSRRESLNIILKNSNKTYTESEIDEMLTYKNDIYKASLINISPKDILPGILDLLDFLDKKNIKTAIGSSSKNAKIILERISLLDRFDVIIDGSVITNTKPDPEVFIKAHVALGLTTKECLVVEDAIAGVEAAHRANIRAVAVGDAAKNKVGDYNILNISEIKNIISK